MPACKNRLPAKASQAVRGLRVAGMDQG